jgi:rare lipoprotein A
MKRWVWFVFVLAGCATQPVMQKSEMPIIEEPVPVETSTAQGDGKYYLDDGPPVEKTDNFVVDAIPQWEEVSAVNSRPYTALGQRFYPRTKIVPYYEKGVASWYGKRYHGRKTSLGEVYDMHKMTAAHPTLPLPSYVRVTRVSDGRRVVVRVNDRGPFLGGRLIDLSYAAARHLGIVNSGTAEVVVEAIVVSPDGRIQSPNDLAGNLAASLKHTSVIASVTISTENSAVSSIALPTKDILSSTAQPSVTSPKTITVSLPETLSDSSSKEKQVISSTPPGTYIQMGFFSVLANANRLMKNFMTANFSGLMGNVLINKEKKGRYFVWVGPYDSSQIAKRDEKALCEAGWCGFLVEFP